MFSDLQRFFIFLFLLVPVLSSVSCGPSGRASVIEEGSRSVSISIPSDEDFEKVRMEIAGQMQKDTLVPSQDGPLIMNAVRDEQTGEMVATDVIKEAKVVARFRHIAERYGKISFSFDINVPASLIQSRWQIKFIPHLFFLDEEHVLEPVFITGQKYRQEQLRGYERYRRFLSTIITDTMDFVRVGQLEVFLERNFPDIYAMKTDTSFMSEPEAEDLFGVSRKQAVEHYQKTFLMARNERRKADSGKMYKKFVKSEIETEGVRLDTVIVSPEGDFTYRYIQTLDSRPGMKKMLVTMDGELREDGRSIFSMRRPDSLVFYVSSLSGLADKSPKYRIKVLERTVYDNTLALIDFAGGSFKVDTMLEGNAGELSRIGKCLEKISMMDEYDVDSVVVTASCSPEGTYRSNTMLARKRSESVINYFREFSEADSLNLIARWIPENWDMMERLVRNDTIITTESKDRILKMMSKDDPDIVERNLQAMPDYRYLREYIYPRLRTVRFGFHMHRKGMEKDTLHTSEIDTSYMKGVEALSNLDYGTASRLLRPYRDYNSALAMSSAGYNYSALDILKDLNQSDARVLYLEALLHSRLGWKDSAIELFDKCVGIDKSMSFRANLDPELAELVVNR